jgi:hypothetical protein
MHFGRMKTQFGRAALLSRDARGQALIETAIGSTVIVLMVAVACNFAYLAYLNSTTASATRLAAITAIQGTQSMAAKSLPTQASACAVAANEVNHWLAIGDQNWGAEVASAPAGSEGWAQTTGCSQGTSAAPTFSPDPEAAYFGTSAVSVTTEYNMPLQFHFLGIGSIAPGILQTSHTLYVRQLN